MEAFEGTPAKRRRPIVCRAPANIGILTVMIVKAVHAMFRRLGQLAGLTCAGWLVACAPTSQPLPVTWTARVLTAAGVGVSPTGVKTAEDLMGRLRDLPNVRQLNGSAM